VKCPPLPKKKGIEHYLFLKKGWLTEASSPRTFHPDVLKVATVAKKNKKTQRSSFASHGRKKAKLSPGRDQRSPPL